MRKTICYEGFVFHICMFKCNNSFVPPRKKKENKIKHYYYCNPRNETDIDTNFEPEPQANRSSPIVPCVHHRLMTK